MTCDRTECDAIVIGQGLAGTALAWALRWRGWRVVIVDREAEVTSSKIAAGLITPITGQRLMKTWRYSTLWPRAISLYERVAQETGQSFLRRQEMVRLFEDHQQPSLFELRRSRHEFGESIRTETNLVDPRFFEDDHGGFVMLGCGQLDIPRYLQASRTCFVRDQGYIAAEIDISLEIEIVADRVRIPKLNLSAKRMIFCQGIEAIENPWFRDVEFKPAKGQILTLRIPGLTEDRVVHRGVWLAPLGNELFRAGSTYEWNRVNSEPTAVGREEILGRMRMFLKLPFELVAHQAAVRPIHRNQFPVVGLHPKHPQLGFINGLGSKGSLQAPFIAEQFAEYLSHGVSIDPEIDLNRKTCWRSFDVDSVRDRTPGSSVQFPVKPTFRLLTQQAQDAVAEFVQAGDAVIDATTGNGHDTQFLSEQVGPDGIVYAFDIQQIALDKTRSRIDAAGLKNVVLIQDDHARMTSHLPMEFRGQIAAVMFNLGYLPGGDKRMATRPDASIRAIAAAIELVRPAGVVTILAYTGHEGGDDEALAVANSLARLPSSTYSLTTAESQSGRKPGPRLFVVKRIVTIAEPSKASP